MVSVIIPTYNFGRYIGQCIRSIQDQSHQNVEIIVVNDGSTDESEQIINEIARTDSRVRPIHKCNDGVSVARNAGLAVATGKYVVFVDGDDYLAEDAIEYYVGLIERSGYEFALSLNCFTRRDEVQEDESLSVISPEKAFALLMSPRLIVGCWNKIYRRDLLEARGLRFSTDLFYGEGLRFITQVAQECSGVCVGSRKVYYYRRNNYSSATSKFDIDKFYNGEKSLRYIEQDCPYTSAEVKTMLEWHKCQFSMGAVVRMKECGKAADHRAYYDASLSNVRKHTWKLLFRKRLSLYKRLLLAGCCVSPSLMACLDRWRRRKIALRSV